MARRSTDLDLPKHLTSRGILQFKRAAWTYPRSSFGFAVRTSGNEEFGTRPSASPDGDRLQVAVGFTYVPFHRCRGSRITRGHGGRLDTEQRTGDRGIR